MVQVETELELVLGVEFAMMPGRKAAPPTSPCLATQVDDASLDENEVIATLNPDFLGAPHATLSTYPCPFYAFEGSLQVEEAEGPSIWQHLLHRALLSPQPFHAGSLPRYHLPFLLFLALDLWGPM